MKTRIFKVASFFMALLVLFSTLSFSVGMHFCGDSLVDFSIFESPEACAMAAEPEQAASTCEQMETDIDCCSDVAFVVQGQQELNLTYESVPFEQQLFATAFVYTYLSLFESTLEDKPHFEDYAPPPLIRDVQILDQTFLI